MLAALRVINASQEDHSTKIRQIKQLVAQMQEEELEASKGKYSDVSSLLSQGKGKEQDLLKLRKGDAQIS